MIFKISPPPPPPKKKYEGKLVEYKCMPKMNLQTIPVLEEIFNPLFVTLSRFHYVQ